MNNQRVELFCLDKWCGERALSESNPSLFAISELPEAKVADVWVKNRWDPRFH